MESSSTVVRANLLAAFLAQLRSGAWLNRERVIAYGRLLFGLETVALIVIALGTYGVFVPLDAPTSTDFLSFFSAGYLADQGHAALIYDQHSHQLAEQAVFGDPKIPYSYWFFYPPTFVTYCALAALLPYLPSFYAWVGLTAAAYVLVLRKLLQDWPLVLAFCSFPAVFITAGIGQNAFLTTAIFGAATLLIDRRPLTAGAILGALCYKPHFLLIAPIALIAGRRWRALGGFAAAVAGCSGLSVLLFGWETWAAFLHLATTVTATFETGKVGFAGLISLFGAVRMLGGDISLAYGVQALAATAAGLLTAFAWWHDLSLPVRAMTLIAATLFSVPVILFYDLLPMTIALGWLVRDARKTGFLPWEKAALGVAWLIPMVSRGAGISAEIPLGPVATMTLLAFVTIRVAMDYSAKRRLA
ncbi:MAG TPA: glycosyltransferase family 87 protein [Aliidongia sp.]|nr:glycosyltransferase family 87 protein [Aliidongia sp.]